MGQNGHANVLVMRKSKNTITVVKKAHTIKNLVLGGLHTRKVNYLSQTYAGKRHDKKIADEESPTLGCLNRLLSVDRFLDSRCQSRLSSAWWRNIFKGSASSRTPHLRPVEFFITI